MARYSAFLDACVIYPAALRDLLMELAVAGYYRARWSARVQEEWIKGYLEKHKGARRATLARANEQMNSAIPEAMVEGYEGLIESLKLPDPNDRHVLAAAIKAKADAIVTWNLKDFPAASLRPFGLEAINPDLFLVHQFHLEAAGFLSAAAAHRRRLKSPAKSPAEYLEGLRAQGLAATVATLSDYKELI